MKFCRTLTKSAAAQDLGPEACWMLTVVAHQEDTCRYRKAITFWNEQLMPLCGFGSRKRLITARNRAIEHGWLHYEAGGRYRPGRYWVLIPEQYQDLPDTPINEESSRSDSEQLKEHQDSRGNESERRKEHQRSAGGNTSGAPFIPSPKPSPTPERESGTPAALIALINGWNDLAPTIQRPKVRVDPPSKDVLSGWKHAMGDRDKREAFTDIPKVLDAIRGARFAHGAGWFTLAKLFRNNGSGEPIITKLLQGDYQDDSANRRGHVRHSGPGQSFDPTRVDDPSIGRM